MLLKSLKECGKEDSVIYVSSATRGNVKFGDVHKCGKWVHVRCAKIKSVTSTLSKGLACEQCAETVKGIVESDKEILFLTWWILQRIFVK